MPLTIGKFSAKKALECCKKFREETGTAGQFKVRFIIFSSRRLLLKLTSGLPFLFLHNINFLKFGLRYFSELSLELLRAAYANDEDYAGLLLYMAQPLLGDLTCLELAYWNKDMKILSHAASQRVLQQVWWGPLCETTNIWMVLNTRFKSLVAALN